MIAIQGIVYRECRICLPEAVVNCVGCFLWCLHSSTWYTSDVRTYGFWFAVKTECLVCWTDLLSWIVWSALWKMVQNSRSWLISVDSGYLCLSHLKLAMYTALVQWKSYYTVPCGRVVPRHPCSKSVPSPSRNPSTSFDVSCTLEHAYLCCGIPSVILGVFLRRLMVCFVLFDCIDLSGLICTMCKVTVKNFRLIL